MAKKFIALKREMSAIEDIRATLKALEKIASANLHNLRITSQKMEGYEQVVREIMGHLAEEEVESPFFKTPQALKRLDIILAQEKGFCGAVFNNLLDFFEEKFGSNEDILLIGERARRLLAERGIRPKYFFHGQNEIPKEQDVREIKDFVVSAFLTGQYREIVVFWPAFKNFATQIPKEETLLPVSEEKFKAEFKTTTSSQELLSIYFPIFESTQTDIVNYLLKEYLGIGFYQKILETKLSELSSRTLFMEEACDKAEALVKSLSLKYFRERREAITKEITELYSHRV